MGILQVLEDSLLLMHFEEIVKFFKMMKTYDDVDGDLPHEVGQLLMKHTEEVQIPPNVLAYIAFDKLDDDTMEADDSLLEASSVDDRNGGSRLSFFNVFFTYLQAPRYLQAPQTRQRYRRTQFDMRCVVC